MKLRHGAAVVAMLLVCSMIVPAAFAQKTRAVGLSTAQQQIAGDLQKRLLQKYSAADIQNPVYVGSQFCVACHKTMSSQLSTNHANFIRRPLVQYSLVAGKGVIADYDNNKVDDFIQGLDFNKISGTPFDIYKPNAPILSVENGTYFVTVGTLKMPVVATLAGQPNGSAQRYIVRVPVSDTPNKMSTSVYFAPLSYTPGTGWSTNGPTGWYDKTTNAPKFAAGIGSAALAAAGGPSNHTASCVGCHTAAFNPLTKTASGETKFAGYESILYLNSDPTVIDYNGDGNMELMNIGCEACHGAGSLHILGGGNPTLIVNPKNLKPQQQSEICGRCHVTGKSVPAGTYSWPMNDATGELWTPFTANVAGPLSLFYTPTSNYWPDGVHINGGRPYNQFLTSAHATFPYHTLGCPDCHDPHSEGEGRLIRETIVENNVTIKSSVEDNSLCVGCHAGYGPFSTLTKDDVANMTNGDAAAYDKIAKVTTAHTNHPYAPQRMMGLSNCTGCHMAMGHNFDAVSPQQTLAFQDKGGMANSCAAGCHNNKVDVFGIGVKGTSTKWNNPFDVTLSNLLKTYFGDGGTWWNTAPSK